MKILYIGNYHQPWSTETYVADSIDQLGHQILRVQEDTLEPGSTTLLEHVSVFKPDLVLWTRTWLNRVSLADLQAIRDLNIPSASYHLDFYVGLGRETSLDSDPFWRTDYVFQIDGDSNHMQVFKDKDINVYYLPAGVFKDDCYSGDYKQKYAHDIVFLGGAEEYPRNEWSYRMKLISWLRHVYGNRFHRYPDDGKRLWGKDMNDLYASSKIAIGDSICQNFTQSNAWSDRVYETTGRGGFIIHPRIAGLEKEFKEHEEIAFYNYGDFEHLKQLIDWYLVHDEYREAVRLKGMNRTKTEHTYHNRMQTLIKTVQNESKR